MALNDMNELKNKMDNFNLSTYQIKICSNMKKIRKELYLKYKNSNKNDKNPYSAQSVSELLNISYEYYKRLESFDKTKPISLKLLIKVSILFDKPISDFFK